MILPAQGGGDFPPGPSWKQFVSIPPSVEGPANMPMVLCVWKGLLRCG